MCAIQPNQEKSEKAAAFRPSQARTSLDLGQICLSISSVSGRVKLMFLMDGSVEWEFRWARLYQSLANGLKSAVISWKFRPKLYYISDL
jgi:hypothetical protein